MEFLLSNLVMGESPRWHDGRLWFAHWGTEEIVAVDLDGNSEVVGQGAPGLGWSIDWLPNGRLLTTGPELLRHEPDGSRVQHADLSGVADHRWNEIVVDGRGNIYLDGAGFDFAAGGAPKPGIIALVTPDGEARQVADDIAFPNGMVVTPDDTTLIVSESFAARLTAFDIADDGSLSNRRAWAEGVGPDGNCMDADGAVWTQSGDTHLHTGRADAPEGECVRVREGGEVLDRIAFDRAAFACALGGGDGRTLFVMAAEWRADQDPVQNIQRLTTGPRTGRVLTTRAPAPHAGHP
jgi:sugar lactone lactonase YvrE